MASSSDVVELIKLVGGPSAVAGLGWWLRGKFSEVQTKSSELLKSHEVQDERRHRQNLVRFAKINTKLGIEDSHDGNGSY